MDSGGFLDWRQLYQTALDSVKDISRNLPEGEQRNHVEQQLKNLEDTLGRADAQLARQLGFKLCECTWPPQIMRWHERDQAHICPNSACGRRIDKPRPVRLRTNYSPRGGDGTGWMGR